MKTPDQVLEAAYEPKTLHDFGPGDIVELKSGSQPLTVEHALPTRQYVDVAWHYAGQIYKTNLHWGAIRRLP